MIWGIVGSEAAKFTPFTERRAKEEIRALLSPGDKVISGKCHLGGIDIWCIEIARAMALETEEHAPPRRVWTGGYKTRNEKIAQRCHEAVCITVRELPPGYDGMRFDLCYHCMTKDHVKSGGCWTVKYARSLGKPGRIIVIDGERDD
jgi:hypothetical protein